MSEKAKNITKEIQEKIKSGDLKMKPKAYFMLSAVLLVFGLVTTILMGSFFTNLVIHRIRIQDQMGFLAMGRPGFGMFLRHFPWTRLALSLASLAGGVVLLKKLDISYKKSMSFISVVLLVGIITGGFVIDRTGFNEHLKKAPLGKRIYNQRIQDPRWLMGTVTENAGIYILVRDLEGSVIKVLAQEYPNVKVGDCVKIIGTRSPDGSEMRAKVIGFCRVPLQNPDVRGIMRKRPLLPKTPLK